MSKSPRLLVSASLIVATLFLAGCESKEEKAARYYQSALELLKAGDVDRALVQLRNVFKYDGQNTEARATYAGLLLGRGETTEAYSQYLRLAEQKPRDADVRRILARTAVRVGEWTEAERHIRAVQELDPDSPGTQALGLILRYRQATVTADSAAQAQVSDEAERFLAAHPDDTLLRWVVIDHLMGGDHPEAALQHIERVLQQEPDSFQFNMLKYRLLAAGPDQAATGAHLRHMIDLYPDNLQVRSLLIGWYLGRHDAENAEAVLRELADRPGATPDLQLALVQLLQQSRGPEAALAELRGRIERAEGTAREQLLLAEATLVFGTGQRQEAISRLEALLEGREPSAGTDRIRVTLARMLLAEGNPVGARAQAEEVLAHDPGQVEALKLRARLLIEADQPGPAIVDLRTALDQAPNDPEILTMLAGAHDRDGNHSLAGEQLAQAVRAAGAAPAESLRYAQFLLQDGRRNAAIAVLTDSARLNPQSVPVRALLADLRLADRDWPRAAGLLDELRAIGTPEAAQTAQRLQAALLMGQNRTEEGIGFLQGLAANNKDAAAVATVVQTQVRSNRLDEARSYLDARLAERPDDPDLRLLSASLDALRGATGPAETELRALLAENPANEPAVRMLYGLLQSLHRGDEASALVADALQRLPQSTELSWMRAGDLERDGKIEEAIALYEALYARDSGNQVIANNLASMITSYRDDPASLERGAAIARRLRGTGVPAFQDTYGWIEFRRGNLTEALNYLQPAAEGLPNDPMVQMHLGLALAAAGRPGEAATRLRRALEIAGPGSEAQMRPAHEALARIPEAEGGMPAAAADTPAGTPADAPPPPGAPPAPLPAPLPAAEPAGDNG